MTFWALSVFIGAAYSISVLGGAVSVRLSVPKHSPRIEFSEIQSRALRMRDIVIPAGFAALIGMFVSLIASFVHEGFTAPVASRLGFEKVNYLTLVMAGGLVSFAGLALSMEKNRTGARDVARHPASINRAATVLVRGGVIDNLDVEDLKRNLKAWEEARGRSALRITFVCNGSPHLNREFLAHEEDVLKNVVPAWFPVRLLLAAISDYPLRGCLVVGSALAVSWLTSAGIVVLLARGDLGGEIAPYILISAGSLAIQAIASLLFLRANAWNAIVAYRVDRIEIHAAKRRIARLSSGRARKSGAISRLVNSFRRVF